MQINHKGLWCNDPEWHYDKNIHYISDNLTDVEEEHLFSVVLLCIKYCLIIKVLTNYYSVINS